MCVGRLFQTDGTVVENELSVKWQLERGTAKAADTGA